MAPKEGMKRVLLVGSPLGYPLSIPTQNLDGAKTVPCLDGEKKHFYAFGNRDFILSHQPQMHAPFFYWEILQIFPSNICLNLDFPLHLMTEDPESFDFHWVWGIPGWRGLFGDQIGISPKNISTTKKQTGPKLEAIFLFLLQQSVDAPPWWCEFFSHPPQRTGQKKCPRKRISASSTRQAS